MPTTFPTPNGFADIEPGDLVHPPDFEGLGPPAAKRDLREIVGTWRTGAGETDDSMSFDADGSVDGGGVPDVCSGHAYRHQKGYLVKRACSNGTYCWLIMSRPRPGKGGKKMIRPLRRACFESDGSGPRKFGPLKNNGPEYYFQPN
ncbi:MULTISPECIES: hypothetical protein [Actinomadura]|uniref:Uncharacterized protein n=1 Tax=Actinomadura yumaensis TaxID=111807 RepID=A0ABW2CXR9_9ACTN|nr:hypothetical protein [Actinomadura sp. J1-007]MWK33261.1 hypothetical protein [Actinomadura sp. J1-007]